MITRATIVLLVAWPLHARAEDPKLQARQHVDRARVLFDKGTNRRQFFRGQVDKYTWVSPGSSLAMS